MRGIITKSTGSWYVVQLQNGEKWRCRVKGKLRLQASPTTNPIAVGDWVEIDPEQGVQQGIIKGVETRKNYVVRQSPHKRWQLHLIAANLDQAVVVVTLRQPAIKLGFIDRFLLTTAAYRIPTVIVFNKADIYDEFDLQLYAQVREMYEKAGYSTLLVSAQTQQGINELRDLLKDKLTLVSGHSGVGKSSLINCIQPNLELTTGEISDHTEKGQHTTTFAEMFGLDFGGQIIDTPGIKELAFANMTAQDVAHNFVEIFETGKNCRFANCMHQNEPFCAVKTAVENGEIGESRYQNYLVILQEIAEQEYIKRQRNW